MPRIVLKKEKETKIKEEERGGWSAPCTINRYNTLYIL